MAQGAETADSRLTVAAERFADPVLVFDDDGVLVFANPAACRRLSVSPDQVRGASFLDVRGEDQDRRFQLVAEPTVWGGKPASVVLLSEVEQQVPTHGNDPGWPTSHSAGTPATGRTTVRCTLRELPALADTFGSWMSEPIAVALEERLRALVGDLGTVVRRDAAFLALLDGAGAVEVEHVASTILAMAQDPIAIDGVLIRLTATVDIDPVGVEVRRVDGPAPGDAGASREGGTSRGKRDKLRSVLFSEPERAD